MVEMVGTYTDAQLLALEYWERGMGRMTRLRRVVSQEMLRRGILHTSLRPGVTAAKVALREYAGIPPARGPAVRLEK